MSRVFSIKPATPTEKRRALKHGVILQPEPLDNVEKQILADIAAGHYVIMSRKEIRDLLSPDTTHKV